jgi:hypothetical protein
MSMLWVTDQVLVTGRYTVPVCIETEKRLIVLLIGPAPDDNGRSAPLQTDVTAVQDGGASLTRFSYGARGDSAGEVIVALFERPSSQATHLDISVRRQAVEALGEESPVDVSARMRRLGEA